MSDMWNTVAPAWERNARLVDEHLAAATEAMLDAAAITAGSAVLEVAAGTGGAGLSAAARVGEGGRVLLTDVAPKMIEAATRRAEGLPHVTARVADELALDLGEDGGFDAVICRHGLMFAEPPEAAVRAATGALRPGGRYATLTWAPRAENPWLAGVFDAVGEHFDTTFPPAHVPGPFALDSVEKLTAALEGGGLQEVVVERVPTPMRAASLEEWWSRVPELAGPLAMAFAGMDPEDRDAIRERALAKGGAAARETDGGIVIDGAVLLGSGVRR